MEVTVLTHGHCFDGLCSAVVFSRLLRELKGPATQFRYVACGYSPSQPAIGPLLSGDQNAILDYRFANHPRLDWYFDHHRTAFASEEDQRHFEACRDRLPYFYDAGYSSCTQLVSDVARERYGVVDERLLPLTEWADKIDSAAFESAEAAIDYSLSLIHI